MAKIIIYGKEVEINYGDYVVDEWWSGEWHHVATYPGTKEGRSLAERKMQGIDSDYVRIEQYF